MNKYYHCKFYGEMRERVRKVLDQAKLNNVTISRRKTQFGDSLKFGGFLVERK